MVVRRNLLLTRLPLLLMLLLWLSMALPASAAAVAGTLRVQQMGEVVVVRLALSEALQTAPSSFALAHPWRLAVDLGGASSLQRQAEGPGAVRGVRVSQFDADTVRLVVDLSEPMTLLSAVQGADHVLELRLEPTSEATFRRQVASGRKPVATFVQNAPPAPVQAMRAAHMDAVERALAASSEPAPPPSAAPPAVVAPSAPPAPVVTARAPRKDRYVVVLDAGHGGTDPGAPSVNGKTEKTVTLTLVQQAKASIERAARRKGLPLEVRLTRDGDYFVRLATRVRRARDWKADLFISVHADSAANTEARGASVYTLSEKASDSMAARLAAKENRADLIAGVDLTGENPEVTNILVDIGMRDSMNASTDFATVLQRGLQPHGVLFRSQFHRHANFQVLRNLGVPAVLLETGYLSNSADAAYLFSAKGQQAIANGIADAVINYLGG